MNIGAWSLTWCLKLALSWKADKENPHETEEEARGQRGDRQFDLPPDLPWGYCLLVLCVCVSLAVIIHWCFWGQFGAHIACVQHVCCQPPRL